MRLTPRRSAIRYGHSFLRERRRQIDCGCVGQVSSNLLLDTEGTTWCDLCLTTGWVSQDLGTVVTDDAGGCVGEDNRDLETTLALDIHEVGLWCLDELLELVGGLFHGLWWVSEVVRGHGNTREKVMGVDLGVVLGFIARGRVGIEVMVVVCWEGGGGRGVGWERIGRVWGWGKGGVVGSVVRFAVC